MKEQGTPAFVARTSTPPSARYRFEATLGQGGMATVYRALDLESGRPVAFKRLRAEAMASSQGAIVGLFEREYLTLAQLAHPRVVQAFDYGVDEQGPYYTMELLDGGDMQALAPLEWSRACAIARDVCSALALLHSRRMVYRDLSPRNVRCTTDGLAKLIDFGAMTPMGLTRELAGTAPCVAPEALNLQPLDARTDLFALGATLYFALVQRHAYPARDLSQLRDVWRSRPRRPSELVAGIPAALDQLVMDLLQLDASLRPANAAEVMARLSAISGTRASEQLIVAQSYLSNPTLVGRQNQLTLLRKFTWRALSRRGGSLLIRGARGVGRTRMLDACVLEAKLAGLQVVRVDARDLDGDADLGIARAIGRQLIAAARPIAFATAADHLDVLGALVPELVDGGIDADESHDFARRAQLALQAWLLGFARKRPLLIAVDDFGLLDERSAGSLALLAQQASDRPILLAITESTTDQDPSLRAARELLGSVSTTIALERLTRDETEQLLESVFGDVANLTALANYVHNVSSGNPRDVMQLAQHLVNEGAIQYSGGAWSLPDRVKLEALPATMSGALAARAEKLRKPALQLAIAFALEPLSRFSFEECVALSRPHDARTVFQTLEELALEDVCLLSGSAYALRQQAWIEPLLNRAPAALIERVHADLAEVLRARGDMVRASGHLFDCQEEESGVQLLVDWAESSLRQTEQNIQVYFKMVEDLPRDWLRTFERALAVCDTRKRPLREINILLDRLEGPISQALSNSCGYHHLQRRLDLLRRECGLDLFEQMPNDLDVAERMKRAIGAAHARFAALPDDEKANPPMAALKAIAQAMICAMGTISVTHDYEAFRRLPDLTPLVALSPNMVIIRDLALGVGMRISGRNERAIAIYEGLIKGTSAAQNGDGVSQAHQTTLRLRLSLSIATMQAAMGMRQSLETLREVEQEPIYAAQSMLARHLYFVWQGNTVEAERCKRQAEVLLIQSNSHHGFEGQHLFSELCAYALADDLTRVKRAADAIEARTHIHPTWLPMLHYAHGEYQRIRGDLATALINFEKALSLGEPGEHPVWANLAGAKLRVLGEQGGHDRVAELAPGYLADAERCELGYGRYYIAMPYSLSLAHLGRLDEAIALAQDVIDGFEALGTTGLNLALAYETRARIALLADDRIGFDDLQRRVAEQWPGGQRRLGALFRSSVARESMRDELFDQLSVLSQFTSKLDTCQSPEQRARCGLEYLMAQSGAHGGLLYRHTREGLRHVASIGDTERSDRFDSWAASYFDAELDREETTEVRQLDGTDESGNESRSPQSTLAREGFMPVLLMHNTQRGVTLSGVALLFVANEVSYHHPGRVASELSRYLVELGDALPVDC